MSRSILLALAFVLLTGERARANTTPVLSLSQNWSNAGLITVNDDWNGVPGIVGRLGDGLTNSGGIDPQTVLADQPTLDVIANLSSPNTETAGGVGEFDGIPDRVVALQGSGTADAPFLLLTLDTTGQSGITISYTLRDIDGSADNAATPVALQYRLSTTGDFTNIPAGYVADATSGPNLATLVTPVSVLLPSGLNNRPTVQLRIITTNATGVDEWVGIDDIQVTPGPTCFGDITSGLPILRGTRSAWGDYDNDGDLDLLLSGELSGSPITRVYRNSGGANPTFTDIMTGLPGLYEPGLAWIDYDADGDLDIFLAGQEPGGPAVTRVYRNNGGPNPLFTDAQVGLPAMYECGAAWGDYDNDGDPDLLLSGLPTVSPPAETRLYRNNGEPAPTFTNVAAGLVGARKGAAMFGDYDNDRDLDILMVGLTDPYFVPLVYQNNGNDQFLDIGAGGSDDFGMAIGWGDYDADGDLDILSTGRNGTEIWSNFFDGSEHYFQDLHPVYSPGAVEGTAAWGDYDSDGKLDFLTAGYSYWTGAPATCLFRRTAPNPQQFEFVGTGMPGVGDDPNPPGAGCAIFGDVDGDNDLDVLLSGGAYTGPDITRVYRNACGTNTRPTAPTGLSMTRVGNRATFQWSAATDAETPVAGLSYNLRVGTAPGLGDIVPPMALANGVRSIPALGNAMENLSWSIDLPGPGAYWWSVQAIDGAYAGSPFAAEQAVCFAGFASMASGVVGIAGGGTAWGDYDNDGDLDLAVSGSTDGTARVTRIYRNDPAATPQFVDIAAGMPGTVYGATAWGDCDNDGDLDLAISGHDGTVALTRIYRNSGGTFTDMNAGLTGVFFGDLTWGDYDTDGDLDLVVTGYTGSVESTRLYRNSGGPTPTFVDSGIALVGMVYSTVSFCDYDKDGDPDMLLTGGPPNNLPPSTILYRNSGGANPTFTGIPTAINGLILGSMSWADYDADGDPDLAICGQDAGNVRRTRIYRNSGGANPMFTDIAAPLTGVYAGSVAWGDFDNDGDFDLLAAGNEGSAATGTLYANSGGATPTFVASSEPIAGVSFGTSAFGDLDRDHDLDIAQSGIPGATYGFAMERNSCHPINTLPEQPGALWVSFNGNRATFSWAPGYDAATPPAALTYNLRIGTTPGGVEVMAPSSSITDGLRRVAARGNVGERTSHTLTLTGDGPWFWTVQSVDAAYEGSLFATEQWIGVSGVGGEAAPVATALWSAGPNPFSGATAIGFSVVARGPVSVTIVDPAGRLVRRLVDDELDPGNFSRAWDGRDDTGTDRASGLYFARLRAGNESRVLRLLLVR